MSDCSIWIVDDDPDDLELIEQAFKDSHQGVRVFESEEAEKIFPTLESLSPAELPLLILLDINMPVMSGKALLEKIKGDDRFKYLPVIMFTTSNSAKEMTECYDKGANCFITKPHTYTQMVDICSSLVVLFCRNN